MQAKNIKLLDKTFLFTLLDNSITEIDLYKIKQLTADVKNMLIEFEIYG